MSEELKRVFAQVRVPVGDDPGQVTPGYYTMAGNVMTMKDGAGTVMRDPVTGEVYQHTLEPGQSETAVARMMTIKIRRAMTGEGVKGFGRKLSYPSLGNA